MPLVQMNALLGFVADALTNTILSLGLERGQEVRTLRAFNKLLWLQNDLINRHYQEGDDASCRSLIALPSGDRRGVPSRNTEQSTGIGLYSEGSRSHEETLVAFAAVLVFSFSVLGWVGTRIYQEAPPLPDQVVTTDGKVVIPSGDIGKGQNVWQAMGGMEVGSIWGHGSYVAPDWSADWLHRECVFILNEWAKSDFQKDFDQIDPEQQAQLQKRSANCCCAPTRSIRPRRRSRSTRCGRRRSRRTSGTTPTCSATATPTTPFPKGRRAIPKNSGSWPPSSSGPRGRRPPIVREPTLSYTSNWPHEPLVSNRPTGEAVVWTGVSVIMLLAGIGAMVWWYASQRHERPTEPVPETDPILGWKATPSQQATVKYFWVVSAMILVQILLGVVTAHYGVEGDGFYGIPLSKWLPYSVTRTWHLQLGVFWIATAWLAAGLFIGPLVSGSEPRGQRFGVNVLFVALLVVVVGSMAGAVAEHPEPALDRRASFYLGHQGYEYIDLGRVWQIGLFVGLLLWLSSGRASGPSGLEAVGRAEAAAV